MGGLRARHPADPVARRRGRGRRGRGRLVRARAAAPAQPAGAAAAARGRGSAVAAWALTRTRSRRASSRCRRRRPWRATSVARPADAGAAACSSGAAVEARPARRVPSARLRRRVGHRRGRPSACLVPLAAFTSVAFSERGIGDRIDELTSETKVAPQEGGGRVFAASSSRGKYWREAFHVFEDAGRFRASAPARSQSAGSATATTPRSRGTPTAGSRRHGRPRPDRALALTTLLFSPGRWPRSARPGCCRAASCARRPRTRLRSGATGTQAASPS